MQPSREWRLPEGHLVLLAAVMEIGIRWFVAAVASGLTAMPRACAAYEVRGPVRQRLLILRKVGDEASTALAAGTFLELFAEFAWRVVSFLFVATRSTAAFLQSVVLRRQGYVALMV